MLRRRMWNARNKGRHSFKSLPFTAKLSNDVHIKILSRKKGSNQITIITKSNNVQYTELLSCAYVKKLIFDVIVNNEIISLAIISLFIRESKSNNSVSFPVGVSTSWLANLDNTSKQFETITDFTIIQQLGVIGDCATQTTNFVMPECVFFSVHIANPTETNKYDFNYLNKRYTYLNGLLRCHPFWIRYSIF